MCAGFAPVCVLSCTYPVSCTCTSSPSPFPDDVVRRNDYYEEECDEGRGGREEAGGGNSPTRVRLFVWPVRPGTTRDCGDSPPFRLLFSRSPSSLSLRLPARTQSLYFFARGARHGLISSARAREVWSSALETWLSREARAETANRSGEEGGTGGPDLFRRAEKFLGWEKAIFPLTLALRHVTRARCAM